MLTAVLLLQACWQQSDSTANGHVPAGWYGFTTADGLVSGAMPAKPETETQNKKSKIGVIKTEVYQAQRSHYYFLVSVTSLPEKLLKKKSATKILNDARDGGVTNMKGQLVSEKKISNDFYQGIALRIASSDKRHITFAELYILNNKLIMLIATTHNTKTMPKKVKQFFNSVKIAETAKTNTAPADNATKQEK